MDGERTGIDSQTVNDSGCIFVGKGRKLQWLAVSICFIAWLVGYWAGDQLLSFFDFQRGGHGRLLGPLLLCIASTIPLLPILLDPQNKLSFVAAKYLLACGILGAMAGGISMLYSSGTCFLCATYLVFGALFSFLLLKHRIPSCALMDSTILFISSAVVSGIRSSGRERPGGASRSRFILGFVFTILACAIDGLLLPLADLQLQEFAGKNNFTSIFLSESFSLMVSSIVCMVGLFNDGNFGHSIPEYRHFRPVNLSDWTTLICSAVVWQIFFLAILGFVFLAYSLFSNVITTVKLPLVP